MNASELAHLFEVSIPKFRELWAVEDIRREENGSFDSYSLTAFFADFLRFEHHDISQSELVKAANAIEQVFTEDPNSKCTDGPSLKDAIILNILSMAVKSVKGGESIEGYLGPISLNHWNRHP